MKPSLVQKDDALERAEAHIRELRGQRDDALSIAVQLQKHGLPLAHPRWVHACDELKILLAEAGWK